MKSIFYRIAALISIPFFSLALNPAANAAGLSSVLDGMFVNATGPDFVKDQLRGGIVGGGLYVRAPISAIQVMAIDPPRFSLGCGGIDAYLGSFSFITADKLIQFMRNVAQNAAPLAFQMALEAMNPQLSGMLKKFQSMAQQMNDLNKNSCQVAHGIMDGKSNLSEVTAGLTKTIGDSVSTAKAFFSDFAAAKDNSGTKPSESQKKAAALTEADGKKRTIPDLGNITWNAIVNRETDGFSYSGIADDTTAAKEILMSMIGTIVRAPGATDADEPTTKPYGSRLSIAQLVKPGQNPDGTFGVPIWKCAEIVKCESVSASYYATSGLRGYVNNKMMGTEDITSSALATSTSIVGMLNSCSASGCALTDVQKKFLNAVGSVPAVGLLRRAQRVPFLVNSIAPVLVDQMTNEIAIQYAETVLNIAVTSYSGTVTPKPDNYDEAINGIKADLNALRAIKETHVEKMNILRAHIDQAILASARAFARTR